jgi:GntR family transcriptional regulator
MGINLTELLLNKNIPVPLYYQLKQLIREQITANKLQIDDYLPTEIELGTILNISRSTVRQALNELVAEGYLYRKIG